MTRNCLEKTIDVHVLHLDDEVDILGEIEHPTISVFHLPGIPGNTLKARILAFQQGSSPYLSFADPDDQVNLEAFDRAARYLRSHPEVGGVYTNSTVVDIEKGTSRPMYREHTWTLDYHCMSSTPMHQLVVFRRDVFEKALSNVRTDFRQADLLTLGEQILYCYIAKQAPWHFLNVDGYTWHKRKTGIHNQVAADRQIWLRKFKEELFFGK